MAPETNATALDSRIRGVEPGSPAGSAGPGLDPPLPAGELRAAEKATTTLNQSDSTPPSVSALANGERAALEARIAELEDAVRVRDAFIFNLPHSTRNPVTPVYLQLRRLERQVRETGDLAQLDWLLPRLTALTECFDSYLRSLDRTRDLALAISGRSRQVLEWVDLSSTVRHVATGLKRQLLAAGIDLDLDEGNAPVMGTWDRSHLETLCYFLLSSAIRFGAGKPITVSIKSDDPWAYLAVTQRGLAVTEQDVSLIFEDLDKREAAAGSLGAGLWGVRRLALAMSGTVDIRGEANGGSTFVVALPCHDI